jgi:hypothetical protein
MGSHSARCLAPRATSVVVGLFVLTAGTVAIGSGTARSASGPAVHPLYSKGVALAGISCTSAGDCTAVGSYGFGTKQAPIYVTERSGVWGPATEVGAPGRASSWSALGGGGFSSVSCASATDCTAVGQTFSAIYSGVNSQRKVPFVATETGGRWGAAKERRTSAALGPEVFFGVSCSSARDCVAIGIAGSNQQPESIYAIESAGVWSETTALSEANLVLRGISCASPSQCTAVGDDQGGRAIYMTEASGSWGAATSMAIPVDAEADLTDVSCSSATDCTAVGTDEYFDPVWITAVAATETAGAWGAATEVGGAGGFNGVSCTSAGDCSAVGIDGNQQPMHATETAGVWGSPGDVVSPVLDGYLLAVSCTAAADCTAIGADGNGDAIYPTETAGVWPAVPDAPRMGTVSARNGAVKVTWSAPIRGPSVSAYMASAVGVNRVFTCDTTHTSCTIRGLPNGQRVVISVEARNPAGPSASSAKKSARPRA